MMGALSGESIRKVKNRRLQVTFSALLHKSCKNKKIQTAIKLDWLMSATKCNASVGNGESPVFS